MLGHGDGQWVYSRPDSREQMDRIECRRRLTTCRPLRVQGEGGYLNDRRRQGLALRVKAAT
jgi:hypothetical protein